MTKFTDDERAAREAALLTACPPGTIFYNSMLSVRKDGTMAQEVRELRCSGHDTLELAIECHERLREEKIKWIKGQEKLAEEILKEYVTLGAFGPKSEVGEFRMVIVKETTELVEESHR